MGRARALKEARFIIARLSIADAAALLGVSVRHYKKMESGRAPVKPLYIAALRIIAGGELDHFGPHWIGCRIIGDHFHGRSMRTFTPKRYANCPGSSASIPSFDTQGKMRFIR